MHGQHRDGRTEERLGYIFPVTFFMLCWVVPGHIVNISVSCLHTVYFIRSSVHLTFNQYLNLLRDNFKLSSLRYVLLTAVNKQEATSHSED